jgi:uridine phosphorylase
MKKLIDQMVNLNIEGLKFANFEMETSSIYGLSHLLGHRAISINAIIANRATGEFSKDPYQTVDKMIAQTLAKIIELKEV